MAADGARKIDPQLAAKYQRLMASGKHHTSALCHLAATLLCRIAHCLRTDRPYELRDVDGRAIDVAEGRTLVKVAHTVAPEIRVTRRRNKTIGPEGPRLARERGRHHHRGLAVNGVVGRGLQPDPISGSVELCERSTASCVRARQN